MTKKEREDAALALVLEMEQARLAYDTENAVAARTLYNLMKGTPEQHDVFISAEASIQRLHGRLSFPASLALGGGYFLVGLLITSPFWYGAR